MADDVAAVLAAAFVGVCQSCYLPEATDEQWETMKPGEGEGLCWDSPACIQGGDLPAFIAETVAPLLATARTQAAEQALRDAAGEYVADCDSTCDGCCHEAFAWLNDRADRLAADHTPPGEAS